jgi:hypothetical protein
LKENIKRFSFLDSMWEKFTVDVHYFFLPLD